MSEPSSNTLKSPSTSPASDTAAQAPSLKLRAKVRAQALASNANETAPSLKLRNQVRAQALASNANETLLG